PQWLTWLAQSSSVPKEIASRLRAKSARSCWRRASTRTKGLASLRLRVRMRIPPQGCQVPDPDPRPRRYVDQFLVPFALTEVPRRAETGGFSANRSGSRRKLSSGGNGCSALAFARL